VEDRKPVAEISNAAEVRSVPFGFVRLRRSGQKKGQDFISLNESNKWDARLGVAASRGYPWYFGPKQAPKRLNVKGRAA
jgi:hypothetical protein